MAHACNPMNAKKEKHVQKTKSVKTLHKTNEVKHKQISEKM